MVAPPDRRFSTLSSRAFVVGPADRGTSEEAWITAGHLDTLPPLILPACRRVVVVAPHPDDEVLAAGGLLQALAGRGARVEICAVTDGEAAYGSPSPALAAVRDGEARLALLRLGLRRPLRRRLRLPDGGVSAHAGELETYLRECLAAGDVCVAPWRYDGHPDHEAAGRASATAATATGAALLEYPVWWWHWADPDALAGVDMARLDLAPPQRAAKEAAIRVFRSQIQRGDCAPVLPGFVLAHFRRPFEVFFNGCTAS